MPPPAAPLSGVFRGRVVWDSLFWSYDDGELSVEWEKYDVFSAWERDNADKEGFKKYVEEGAGREGGGEDGDVDGDGDELQSLVDEMSGDVLYLESEYWSQPFVLHDATVESRPGEDDGMINVDEYVDSLIGGKKVDYDSVDRSMYEMGLNEEDVEVGKRDGIIEEIVDDV